MDELGIFCLFILNDREMNKKSFYTPIKEYIDYLENLNNKTLQEPIKIISDYEKDFMKLVNKIKTSSFGNENMNLFSWYLAENKFDIKIFEKIKNLPSDLNYDFSNLKNSKNVSKFLMNKNNLKKSLFIRATKEVKEATEIIKNNLLDKYLDLDLFIKNQEFIDLDVLNSINK